MHDNTTDAFLVDAGSALLYGGLIAWTVRVLHLVAHSRCWPLSAQCIDASAKLPAWLDPAGTTSFILGGLLLLIFLIRSGRALR